MPYSLAALQAEFLIEEETPKVAPRTGNFGRNGGTTAASDRRLDSLLRASGGKYERCLHGKHDYASDSEACLAVVDAMVARHFTDAEIWATLDGSELMRRRIEKKGDHHARELFEDEVTKARAEVTLFEHDPGRESQKPRSEAAGSVGTDEESPDFPEIIVTDRRLRDLAAEAWAAQVAANNPPVLFQHGGGIAEVRRDEEDRPVIQHLDLPGIKGLLDRNIDWLKDTKKGLLPARPPRDVIEDMISREKPLPVIRGIVGTPVFSAEGVLVTNAGYQDATRLYYAPVGHPVRPVPAAPSAEDMRAALDLLCVEWLGEFPFADPASRANLLGAALTPLVREMIPGPTPLHLLDAPTPGTGKGLLAETVSLVAFGAAPGVMSDARVEEEMRKRITSVLKEGTPVILIDNINRKLASESLAAALTSIFWSDRLLGVSNMVRLPNRSLWLATGNNVELSNEIARRTVWTRLDARADRPWERQGFRHPSLSHWVATNRHELVWALLILAQNWIALGRPAWEGVRLGTFEDWCSVVGGVLQAAGFSDFLANREHLYRAADTETAEWHAFVESWWERHAASPVRIAELLPLTQELGLLSSVFARARDTATVRSLSTRLGSALMQRRDRRFGRYYIRYLGNDGHAKVAQYRLDAEEGEAAGPSTSAPAQGPAKVPHQNGPVSDSNAGPAGPAGPDSASEKKTDRGSQTEDVAAAGRSDPLATGVEVPQVTQVPQTDSKPPFKPAGPLPGSETQVPQGTAEEWREELS